MNSNLVKYTVVALALATLVVAGVLIFPRAGHFAFSSDSANPSSEPGSKPVHNPYSGPGQIPASIYSLPIQSPSTVSPQPSATASPVSSSTPTQTSTSIAPQPTATSTYISRSQPTMVKVPTQHVPQQVVIKFGKNSTAAERAAYIKSIGGKIVKNIAALDTVIVNVSEKTAQEPLPTSAIVADSQPDYYVSALDNPPLVNDPRYAEQWALPAIGAPAAWAELPANSPKVIIAVIDSGICAANPDLAGRIVDGWDFLENDAVPQDDFGHGCSVAGVIAANVNDGIGIAGVAPNAQIMPLRVLNAQGVGSYSDVAAAIVYAADHGAQVINLSLGGSNPSSTLENAVNYAISKGLIVVAAAGNNGTEGALYPAAYPAVIAVGSVDPNLQHSSFSNYGSQVDIWAPGRDILTTKRDGSYGLVSGTSFAAPYVAGAEALVQAFEHTIPLSGEFLSLGAASYTPTAPPTPIIIPSGTPALSQTPVSTPAVIQGGGDYVDKVYGFQITLPENWYIKPATNNLGSYAEITNYLSVDSQPAKAMEILIGVMVTDRPENVSLSAWLEPQRNLDGLISQTTSFLGSYETIVQDYTSDSRFGEIIYISEGSKIYYIATTAQSQKDMDNARYIFDTFKIVKPYDAKQETVERLWAESQNADVTAESTYGYRLPFGEGPYQITQGPNNCGGTNTHVGKSSEAIDFGMAEGTDISAMAAGDITYANMGWNGGFGNQIKINHNDGQESWYNHLSSFIKTSGHVDRGEHIAESGNSGNSGGPHLHLEVRNIAADQSISIRRMPGISWVSGDPNNPCQSIGTNDGEASGGHYGVYACSEANFTGTCEWFSSTDWDLTDNAIGNDSITSLAVPSGWGVRFWQNTYSQGRGSCLRFPPVDGDTPFYDLANKLVWEYCDVGSISNPVIGTRANNQISAIEIYSTDLFCGQDLDSQCYIPPTTVPPTQTPPPTTPPGTVDGFKLISVSSPTVQKGQTFPVTVIYEIVSGQLLQSRGDHLFGSDPTYGAWPVQAVTGTYNPGQQITFTFNLTAPQQTGTFTSNWQLKIGGNLKGQQAVVRFTVQDAPSPPSGGPAGYTHCADEDGTCNFSGIADVAYGANGQFYYRSAVYSSIGCNNNVFGDPISGTRKACYYKLTSGGTGVWNAGYYDTVDRWWDNNNSGNYRCSETINSQFLDVNYGSGARCGMDPDTWVGDYTTTANFSSGNYVFYVEHDDGLKLWVNGQNVADRGGSGSTYVCPPRALNGATQLKVMLREDGGDAKVKVTWSTDTNLCAPPPPDLAPYNRDGASQPVVASLNSGNRNQDTLVAGQRAYFDWGYKNIGAGDAGPHHVKLWIGGQQFIDYPFNGLGAGNLGGFDDWEIVYPNTGCYTVTLTVDSESQVSESNEGNNSWSGTMCWNPPPQPDLVPFPRPGASDPVVVSRYWDWPYGDTLISDQGMYFYWGYKNIGQSDAGPYYVEVYVDDHLFIDYPFDGLGAGADDGFDNWYENFYVSPGPHQVRIVVDPYDQVAESNEDNNEWTGMVYWRDPTVSITDIYTTDENGTAEGLAAVGVKAKDAKAKTYKTDFTYGDPIQLYFDIQNDFPDDQTITKEWEVTNPFGEVVPELSLTETTLTGTGVWWWYLDRTIPDYLARGEYTFTGRVTFNGVTTVKSTTFTISGPPSVEVLDTFTTDANGLAASLEAGPQKTSGQVTGKAIAMDFSAGDGIQLFIQTYNDVAADEPAYFDWSVYDPLGRYVKEMNWSGELNSYSDWSWWSLSSAIPAHAITGDYTFIGSITYGGRTTYSESVFHVVGSMPAPSNDAFGSPSVIGAVPFDGLQDTWTATVAVNDPVPNCGSDQNSNSVWYRYTPAANGILHVDTFGSDYDTVVTVWTGSIGSLVERGCSDDSFGELQSWLETPAVAGTTYYVEVMDYGYAGGGNLNLNVDFAQSVSNDDFNSPTLITTLPYPLTKDVRGATQANDDPALTDCNRLPGQASVWYKYTPALSGQLVVNTLGSDYDTILAVWSGTHGNLTSLGCNDDIGDVDGSWDTVSTLTVNLVGGTTYYIEVAAYAGMIDIDGASATGLHNKDWWKAGDVANLGDLKTAIDHGKSSLSAQRKDVGAQFWGGQMQLQVDYHPAPTTPALVSPAEGATQPRTNNTLLDWNTSNADACSVHVWGGSIDITSGDSCADQPLGEQRGGAYSWQVTSTNTYGSTVGPIWHFNIRPYAPTSLLASVPSSTQVDLAWTLSSDEPADVDSYDIYRNASLLANVPKGTTSYPATGLTCNTSYSFSVRARRQSVQSDNSNTVNVTPPCPPAAFNKTSPANGAINQPTSNLTLSWGGSAGAANYEYCIGETNNNNCSWTDAGTSTSVSVNDLKQNTTYYWHVRAHNSVGVQDANNGNWWSFTTEGPPLAFNKTNPTTAAVNQPVNLTLSWSGSLNASRYEYCYDTTDNNACDTVLPDKGWINNGSSPTASLVGLGTNTTYYWHVISYNSLGSREADNGTWSSFTTAPLSVLGSTRANTSPTSATIAGFTVSFSKEVTGIDTAAPFSDFALVTPGITGASIVDVIPVSGATYTVHVNTGSGSGTIRLDVIDDDTIVDSDSHPLGNAGTGNGNYTSGETYLIDRTPPELTLPSPITQAATSTSGAVVYFSATARDSVDPSPIVSCAPTSGSAFPLGVTTVHCSATDAYANVASGSFDVTVVDKTAPLVTTITLASAYPTAAANVDFIVTFSESVMGVDATDFSLTTAGVSGAAVSGLSGSGGVYTVTINTGSGDGTIRLDIPASAAIADLAGNPLASLPYTSGQIYTVNKSMTFSSLAAQDGWVLELSEVSNKGGTINNKAPTFNLGDDSARRQYRAILSFSTGAGLPDNAVITGVTLKIKKNTIVGGGNPVAIFQGFMVDIKNGLFGTAALQGSDFQAGASHAAYGPFKPAPVGNWYSIDLTRANPYINKLGTGLTQIRLRFKLDDNNNAIANYISLFSGDAPPANRPQLIIMYYVP